MGWVREKWRGRPIRCAFQSSRGEWLRAQRNASIKCSDLNLVSHVNKTDTATQINSHTVFLFSVLFYSHEVLKTVARGNVQQKADQRSDASIRSNTDERGLFSFLLSQLF